MAALSDSGVEGQLRQNLVVQPDSRNRFVVAGRNQVIVYDSVGHLLQSFGRSGQGPGEFARLVNVTVGPGDSMYAFDIGSARLSVIAPNLTYVRGVPLRYTPMFALRDGSFIVAQQIPTAQQIGYPLHRVLPNGTVALSFGTDVPQYRPDLSPQLDRVTGPGRDGSIWAAPLGRYVLERFDPLSGNKLDSVRVPSPWFRESAKFGDDLRVRPKPIVDALWEDDVGFVWVLLRDADEAWVASTEAELPMSARSSPEEFEAIYDWVLEVVDPDNARVVASRRLRSYPRIRHPAHSFISFGPDSSHVVHHVWKLSLVQKEKP